MPHWKKWQNLMLDQNRLVCPHSILEAFPPSIMHSHNFVQDRLNPQPTALAQTPAPSCLPRCVGKGVLKIKKLVFGAVRDFMA